MSKKSNIDKESSTSVIVNSSLVSRIYNSSKILKPSRVIKAAGLIMIMLLLATAGVLIYQDRKENNTTNNLVAANVCATDENKDLLQTASTKYSPTRSEDLGLVVEQILALENYDTDVNCLYVVARYEFNINNVDAAKSNLEKLNNLLKEDGVSFVEGVGISKEEVQDLEVLIQAVESNVGGELFL